MLAAPKRESGKVHLVGKQAGALPLPHGHLDLVVGTLVRNVASGDGIQVRSASNAVSLIQMVEIQSQLIQNSIPLQLQYY